MARSRVNLPAQFSFSCQIPVRITDINYAGHVGNDRVLSILHEARMQFFRHWGYTELDFGGVGTIMADVVIEFKSELFYGDVVKASVKAGEFSKIGFELLYKLEKGTEHNWKIAATAKTGMVCFDYEKKKIVAVPWEARKLLSG